MISWFIINCESILQQPFTLSDQFQEGKTIEVSHAVWLYVEMKISLNSELLLDLDSILWKIVKPALFMNIILTSLSDIKESLL